MYIKSLKLKDFRSFSILKETFFSKNINVLIGANNSGKSSILLALLELQNSQLQESDIRIGTNQLNIIIEFGDPELKYFRRSGISELKENRKLRLNIRKIRNSEFRKDLIIIADSNVLKKNFVQFMNSEPQNVVYPYLSRRKAVDFSETINEEASITVTGNFRNLYAKIDRISTEFYPHHDDYVTACEKIIGFPISAIASPNGKKAAYIVSSDENIPLSSMGEGIVNLVGLIVDLCIAENKIFIIEEPENDIHPEALKSLLELIIAKSDNNQFIISTHSNIVARYLGSVKDSKLFKVAIDSSNQSQSPVSTITEISQNVGDRLKVLEELGYEFADLYLWSAWLFFEESSSEFIVREYLIPWFFPKINGRIRTFSARTKDELKLKFNDFNRLFIFLHLEPIYRNKVWVIIDGGDPERKIIEDLKNTYTSSGWREKNFIQLSKHNFEEYYPDVFQNDVEKLNKYTGLEKQDRKNELLETLKKWVSGNLEEAKIEFKKSFKEIIEILESIQNSI